MDFFAVPHAEPSSSSIAFSVIEHKRGREAVPDAGPYHSMILDHDSKFSDDLITVLKATGLQPKRTSVRRLRSKWNRRALGRKLAAPRLQAVFIALDKRHLRRLRS